MLHGKKGVERIRGALVHGVAVPISVARTRNHVENPLAAPKAAEDFAVEKGGGSLFCRILR